MVTTMVGHSLGVAFRDFEVRQMMLGDKWRSTRILDKGPVRLTSGSIVYVKEAWSSYIDDTGFRGNEVYAYRADNNMALDSTREHTRWMPANFMPRWASRILLYVSKVYIQRLQEIVYEELILEGFKPYGRTFEDSLYPFVGYWNESVRPLKYKWEANPLVFVYEWDRMLAEEEPIRRPD